MVFYLTVILLLFGNNISCPRNLFSPNSKSSESPLVCHHQACEHLQNSPGNVDSRCRDQNQVERNDHHSDSPAFNDDDSKGSLRYKYHMLNSSEDFESCKSCSDDAFEDTDIEEDDVEEVENPIVVDKKGGYTLSYPKKIFECHCSHCQKMKFLSSSLQQTSCCCESSAVRPKCSFRHYDIEVVDKKECGNSLNQNHQFTIRQQKLHYLEQQLKAQNVENSEIHQEEETNICKCMSSLPYSKSFLLQHSVANRRALSSSNSESAIAEVHRVSKPPNAPPFLALEKERNLSSVLASPCYNKNHGPFLKTDCCKFVSSCSICAHRCSSLEMIHPQCPKFQKTCQFSNCPCNLQYSKALDNRFQSECLYCKDAETSTFRFVSKNVSDTAINSNSALRLADLPADSSPVERLISNIRKMNSAKSDCDICVDIDEDRKEEFDSEESDSQESACSVNSDSSNATCVEMDQKLQDIGDLDDLELVDVQVQDLKLSEVKFGGIEVSRENLGCNSKNPKQDLHVILLEEKSGSVATKVSKTNLGFSS